MRVSSCSIVTIRPPRWPNMSPPLTRDGGSGIADGDGHFYRAVARCARQDWVEANSDFETARQKGVLVASSLCAILGGVSDFEVRYGVRIPSAIGTMLHVI